MSRYLSNLLSAILLLMIGWDLSLHLVELFKVVILHPLYPYFPLFNIITYDVFWSLYWAIAFIMLIVIIGRRE